MPTSVAIPNQNAPAPENIVLGGFYPDISISHFRDTQRIGGKAITEQRTREKLIEAALKVDELLADFVAARNFEGYNKLSDVPCAQIAGISKYVRHWQHAVYSYAMAFLISINEDISATGDGIKANENNMTLYSLHLSNATDAINSIIGDNLTGLI